MRSVVMLKIHADVTERLLVVARGGIVLRRNHRC